MNADTASSVKITKIIGSYDPFDSHLQERVLREESVRSAGTDTRLANAELIILTSQRDEYAQ